ncbi:hypothetical protein QBC43DRAFT_338284 [Cladorrhinum sp. PSN259]|nr:hypothetical protein QBC43DRAFT_338284 [Cladorrhinum sp. PSN259]
MSSNNNTSNNGGDVVVEAGPPDWSIVFEHDYQWDLDLDVQVPPLVNSLFEIGVPAREVQNYALDKAEAAPWRSREQDFFLAIVAKANNRWYWEMGERHVFIDRMIFIWVEGRRRLPLPYQRQPRRPRKHYEVIYTWKHQL